MTPRGFETVDEAFAAEMDDMDAFLYDTHGERLSRALLHF